MTEVALPVRLETTTVARTPWQLFWSRFSRDRVALAALAVVLALILVGAGGGPLAAKITGHPQNTPYENMTDEFGVPLGPNSHFWFGADSSGRDLFVRTMYGARTSLIVGVVASGFAVLIGVVVGVISGFAGGVVDTAFSRAGDVLLALPQVLIAAGLVVACGTTKSGCVHGLIQPGLSLVIIVIVLFSWTYIARVMRSITLSLREKEFVEASRSLGSTNFSIIVREILPNLVGPIIVYTTILIPQSILFEAALSYLGLGLPPDQASWGSILRDASGLYDVAWWLMVFPGLFLVITTLAFNLLGDGLRDALDVRAER